MRVDGDAAEQLQETIRRLEAEQAQPRPLTDPSIDQTSFGTWLGDVRPAVREFWEDWSQGLANAAVDEISLYAALCLWGDEHASRPGLRRMCLATNSVTVSSQAGPGSSALRLGPQSVIA